MEKKINWKIRNMIPDDNKAVAYLVRYNLKKHGLDIPGTVYFDAVVDSLYEYYSSGKSRGYYVLVDDKDTVLGGIGLDEFPLFKNCAELQKLYLADSAKGNGLGYELIKHVEKKMLEKGYKASYLETHSNLEAAIHIYEKSGYSRIDKPKEVMHGAMNVFLYKSLEN